jgi:hypothetical protein
MSVYELFVDDCKVDENYMGGKLKGLLVPSDGAFTCEKRVMEAMEFLMTRASPEKGAVIMSLGNSKHVVLGNPSRIGHMFQLKKTKKDEPRVDAAVVVVRAQGWDEMLDALYVFFKMGESKSN